MSHKKNRNFWKNKHRKKHPPKPVVYPDPKPGEVWYTAYTDGSSLGNPGPAGYGIVVRLGDTKVTLSKGYNLSTNNRMEMMAVIALLEEFGPNKRFNIYLDSQYTMDGGMKWIYGWNKRGWVTGDGQPVKNRDLWMQMYDLLKENEVRWHKVPAHTGIPDNEEADQLAKAGAGAPTEIDHGYVAQQ